LTHARGKERERKQENFENSLIYTYTRKKKRKEDHIHTLWQMATNTYIRRKDRKGKKR
jgi:hypothetical protein